MRRSRGCLAASPAASEIGLAVVAAERLVVVATKRLVVVARAMAFRSALGIAVLAIAAFPSQASALQPPLPESVRDLPLRVFPAATSEAGPSTAARRSPTAMPDSSTPGRDTATPGSVFALVMSGDGNWAPFASGLARALVAEGIPVVGLASRSYLSRKRTPAGLSSDMVRVLRTYLSEWEAERVLIVGYSRGADFAPFLVNRLPADLRERVIGVGLFSPTRMASFEFHLTDLVRYTPRDSDLPAVPEVAALAPLPVLCVYGTRDASTLCPLLPEGVATVRAEEAGHRLSDPERLVGDLLARVLPPAGGGGLR